MSDITTAICIRRFLRRLGLPVTHEGADHDTQADTQADTKTGTKCHIAKCSSETGANSHAKPCAQRYAIAKVAFTDRTLLADPRPSWLPTAEVFTSLTVLVVQDASP